MKRRFTILTAALALLVSLAIPMGVWGQTTTVYEQLTSIANIDENAQYVLGIEGTGFHYEGTSSWGKTALPSAQTPIYYTLTKANDGNSFTAHATIDNTTYYLQVPTSNTFSMATAAGTNTDLIIGTTQVSGTNYAVANKTTTARHLRINGTSGLRSYAGTTGTMAFFYKVVTGASYTVTYYANVVGTDPIEATYLEGATVTVAANTFSNPGYAFTEWNTMEDGTGDSYSPDDEIENINTDIDLYAQWEESDETVDELTYEFTGISGASYAAWSNKTGASGAVYAGRSGGNYNSIQLNNSSPNGIVSTTSGGKVTKVVVTWNSNTSNGRSVDIYGSNTAYEGSADLYDTDKRGTKLGSVVKGTSTELTISGDYSYIGICNPGSAVYLDKVEITWSTAISTDPSITASDVNITYDATSGEIEYTITNPATNGNLSVSENVDWISNAVVNTSESKVTFSTTANEATTAREGVITLTYTYGDNETVTKDVTVTQAAAPVIYTTIPALFEAATSTATDVTITFGSWVISAVHNSNAYLTDNQGHGLIIYASDHGFQVNDVLTGTVNCKLQTYRGSAELTNLTSSVEGLSVSHNGTVAEQNIAINTLGGVNTGALLAYQGLTYNGTALVDGNNNTITPYTTLYSYTFEEGKTYNVKGIYLQYNSTKEILPRSADDIEEVVVTTPIINAENVNIAYDATSGEIAYTITNPVDGQNLTATTTADWISNISVANDKVIFTTTANEGNSDRTATITLSYTGATDKVITVTQGHYVAPVTGDKYVKVTSTTDLTSGQYLIVYEEGSVAFDGSLTTLDAASNTISVVTNNNEIGVDNITTAAEFTIDVTNGTLKSASGKYIGVSSNSNGLKQTDNASTYTNSFSIDNNGNAVITAVFEGSNMTMRYNNASNQNRFRYYSNGQQAIQLYKKVVEPVTETHTLEIEGYGETQNPGGWYLIASPIGNVAPTNVAIEGIDNANMVSGTFDLFYFDHTKDNEWVNYKDNTSGEGNASTDPGFNLISGKGYLYANSEDVTLVFTGTAPTDEKVEVTLDYNANAEMPGWNLVGNPFAVTANIMTQEGHTLYFYTLNAAGDEFVAATNTTIDPMEGVFVEAKVAGEKITFTRGESAKGSLVALNLSNGRNIIDRAIVRFNECRPLHKLQLNKNHSKVYISMDGEDYAVVRGEEMGEMPVSFKAENNGNYTLSVNAEEVSFAYLHLIDNMTGNDVDLLQTSSYSFEAKTTDYESRFKLVFATGDNSNDDNFAFYSNGSFVINNEGNAELQVIDIMGRIVKSESINGCANVSVNGAAGVYMLRLVNGDIVKTQKVVVK